MSYQFILRLICFSIVLTSIQLLAQDGLSVRFVDDADCSYYGALSIEIPSSLLQNKDIAPFDWAEITKVYVGKQLPKDPDFPAISGTYELIEQYLIFKPTYFPTPGIHYTVFFDLPLTPKRLKGNTERPTIIQTIQVPDEEHFAQNQVVKVSPETAMVPSNLLKFYIHFSSPMGFENPYNFINLLSEDSIPLSNPFVKIPSGLWDDQRKRLTLLIHPGRIKRGVGPLMAEGPVLEEGKTYHLEIDKKWTDSNGQIMERSFTKSFVVTTQERDRIDLSQWRITLPKARTLNFLQIVLPKLLDEALAERLITVHNQNDEEILTTLDLRGAVKTIFVKPGHPWRKGVYSIRIDQRLEDLAGNRFNTLFDNERSRSQENESTYQRIEFKIH